MGLERWNQGSDDAAAASAPASAGWDAAARFRRFCIDALRMPARLFPAVAFTCVSFNPGREGRRSCYRMRMPSVVATAVLAAAPRLPGADCPVSLDVWRAPQELRALHLLRCMMQAGAVASCPSSRADAASSWRAAGAEVVPSAPTGAAEAEPTPPEAGAEPELRGQPMAAPPCTHARSFAPSPTPTPPEATQEAAEQQEPAELRLPEVGEGEVRGPVECIVGARGRGRQTRYRARFAGMDAASDLWVLGSGLSAQTQATQALVRWRRQRNRETSYACRARQTAGALPRRQPVAGRTAQAHCSPVKASVNAIQVYADADGDARRSRRIVGLPPSSA